MSEVQAVVFDIGNVLIEWQPERHYDRVIGQARRKAMFEAVDLHAMNDLVDRGAPFKETVYAAADEVPAFADDIRRWHSDWLQMASPAIPLSVALLRALRAKGVPVFALSNFGVETFALAEVEYPFLKEFDRRYISGHMRMVKPFADIYAALEEDCGVEPAGLLFADDRADNIAAAQKRGWQTHLFTDPLGWAACLEAKGVLTHDESQP